MLLDDLDQTLSPEPQAALACDVLGHSGTIAHRQADANTASRVPSADNAFRLRMGRPQDFDRLNGFAQAALPDILATSLPEAPMAANLLARRVNPRLLASGSYALAEPIHHAGTVPIWGAGGWTWTGPLGEVGPRHLVHMRDLYVAPERQGQGIGRALMGCALAGAAAAGARMMDAQVLGNDTAFYERFGFETLGPILVTMAPGLMLPATHMRRRLA